MSRRTNAQAILALVIVCALAAGFLVTGGDTAAQAAADAGPELVRLLRAMAMLKALMAAAAVAVVLWRLVVPVTRAWLAAYALACAAMAAAPGLIWDMAHVGAGAILLHGGLLATILLLWRDGAVAARLRTIVAARRGAASVVQDGVQPGGQLIPVIRLGQQRNMRRARPVEAGDIA